ncbi:hypothetical protein JVT61DRAFT_11385 [Boletus reticuloceps]|uniref:Uncharacterized protein n=1 Tax=Boletus reticuloceps TaxID=495285 RepID=A0A8I2YER7_9AGAM|nr:hypothetical protein JVT61DRAFT_11385 [Boletus reticuloceps]
MRVLSFILAFLLVATTSFVSAAAAGTPTDTTVPLSPPITGSGNGIALQTLLDIVSNATAQMKPLNDQLASAASGAHNVDTVTGIVEKFDAVISNTLAQLKSTSVSSVDASIFNPAYIYPTIDGLLGEIIRVLTTLLSLVLFGDNLAAGGVISLINVFTYLVGLVLLLLQHLGALGILGPGGLLSSLLGTLTLLSPA